MKQYGNSYYSVVFFLFLYLLYLPALANAQVDTWNELPDVPKNVDAGGYLVGGLAWMLNLIPRFGNAF